MRHRLGREVPVGDVQVWCGLTQLSDDFGGKLPAHGLSAHNAGMTCRSFMPKPFLV